MIKNKFDVIVVGAGPAGTAAAFKLAKEGVDVALVERGSSPGSKNMFGGIFYGRVLHQLIPNFWEEAPIERIVTKRVLTLNSTQASLSVELNSRRYAEPPYNGFTILRGKFDNWFVSKAVEAGVSFIPATTVDGLIYKGKQIVGVKTRRENGELFAKLIIAADGANSFLAHQAGLRPVFSNHHLEVAVKEVIKLPKEVIEERFKLRPGEGMANEFVGGFGVKGGGFIYTNQNTVAVGVAVELASLKEKQVQIVQVLEDFKQHPTVMEMIRGGITVEYGGHLIPAVGYKMMPKLYTDGMLVVGDAAGMVLATGLTLEGMNYAMAGGVAAAEAASRALKAGCYSAAQLKCYKSLLEESFVLHNLKEFRHASTFIQNPRLHDTYAPGVTELSEQLFMSDGLPRQKLMQMAKEHLYSEVGLLKLLKDIRDGGRGLLW